MLRIRLPAIVEPDLVGREDELKELMNYLDLSLAGKGTTVFISGEAGCGKTKLAGEFLNLAKKKDITLLLGWCFSGAATPYFPFIEAFKNFFQVQKKGQLISRKTEKQDLASSQNAILKKMLSGPRNTDQEQDLTPEAWKDLTYSAVSDSLISISTKKPTIVFFEDIHWADSASLALLRYLSHIIGSERILILATFRSDELSADSEGRSHPLLDILRQMKREDLFKEIKLSTLGQDCIADITKKMIGENLEPELVSKLSERSKGNPLFVVESIRMWNEKGSLVKKENGLNLSIDDLGVPTKFKDIILSRLGTLKSSQRRVLDIASAIGEKFDSNLLSLALGQDILDVLETLNEVAQATSLVYSEGDTYRFDHARTRDILYEEIPPPLKKGYHLRIAQRIENTNTDLNELPLGIIAYHYAQAGNIEKSIEYASKSGNDALARFSNSEAIKQYNYLLKITENLPKYSTERENALSNLGFALHRTGLHFESLKTFSKLFEVTESGAMKLHALRMEMHIALWWGEGSKKAIELATIAQQFAEYDKMEYARVRMTRATAISREGKVEEALETAKEVLRTYEEQGSLRDIATGLFQITNFYARMDLTPAKNALSTILRAATMYKELGDLHFLSECLLTKSNMFFSCGLFEEALENFAELIKLQKKIGEHNHALPYFWISNIYETRGLLNARLGKTQEGIQDYKTAIEQNLTGIKTVEKSEAYFGPLLVYGNLVRLYIKLDQTNEAEKFYGKLEELLQKSNNADPWLLALCFRSKAIFQAAKGNWQESNMLFEKSFASFEKMRWLAFPIIKAETRIEYAASLEKQQRQKEAILPSEQASQTIENYLKIKEDLNRANVQLNLLIKKEAGVGEELILRLDLVNVAKNRATLIKLENIIPTSFKVTHIPEYVTLQNNSLIMESIKLDPFQVEPIRISLQPTKAGNFEIEPELTYIDQLGETKTCKRSPFSITVRPTLTTRIGETIISVPILPNRLTTGFMDLDVMLYGGIPEKYAVVLTSAPNDERELLIKQFIRAGVQAKEPTFYITTDASSIQISQKLEPNMYIFACNPKAESIIQDLPNLFKLKGIESLTDIDIALIKAFRKLDPSYNGPKRACVEIVSDVLLQHHVILTRKWLSGLLADLKSKGFTTLAVFNPNMHSQEDVQAVLSLFEGEIRISEKESTDSVEKILRVRKLCNQKYLEKNIDISGKISLVTFKDTLT